MQKRIDWIDFAKGFTIFLVVFFHGIKYPLPRFFGEQQILMNDIASFLFVFIMPVFFSISGYLYKRVHNISEYMRNLAKKIKAFLVPYVFFSILYVTLQNINGSGNVNKFRTFGSLIYIFTDPVSYTWFLMAMFLIFAIVGLFNLINISLKNQLVLSIILSVIEIIFGQYMFDSLRRALTYLLFFCLGECLRLLDENSLTFLKNKIINAALPFSIIILFIFQLYNINDLLVQIVNVINGILCIIFWFNLFKDVDINSKIGKYFTKIGKYSLIIYLVHVPVIAVFKIIIVKIVVINNATMPLVVILLTLIGWYSSIISLYLAKRFKWISFIFYPKFRK